MQTTALAGESSTVSLDSGSRVSWGAVIGGGIASVAVTLLLIAFGVGAGLSAVSPWSNEGVSATTFQVGAGVYLVVVAMLSSTVGGFLTGRMRATWTGVHEHEVYFRDTAHGFLTWAFATVLGATILGAAATHIVAGASAGLIPATGAATASAASNPTDAYVDTLLRSDSSAGTASAGAGASQTSPGTGDNRATRDELGRMFAPTLRKGGDISAADRTYMAKVVSARTGLSQQEAEKRVSDTITQAKQAADDARKAAAKFALWLAASMLAGALAAMLGATEGGMYRESRWYEPGWRASRVH
jgi:hypothetical protein